MSKNVRNYRRISVQKIALTAMFIALSVVLKLFLGIPIAPNGTLLKDLNLSPAIIMWSGIALGPVYGGIVGAAADILVFLVRPLGGYMPFFTITNALMGAIPGLFFLKEQDRLSPRPFRSILATASSHIVTSVVLNTLLLIWLGYYTPPVAWARNVSSLVTLPIYILVILVLNKAMTHIPPSWRYGRRVTPNKKEPDLPSE